MADETITDHIAAMDALFRSSLADGKALADIVDDLRSSICAAYAVIPFSGDIYDPAKKILRQALQKSTDALNALERTPTPGDDTEENDHA